MSHDTSAAAAIDYDAVVEQFYEAIYKFAFSLAGNAGDAADLTQDAYRVLLAKGDVIRDARKVKIWLFTTLYRQFLGRRHHAARFPESPVESAEWELPAVTPSQVESLDACVVVSALQGLEEKYRAPLTLFYLEEFSYKETAEVLQAPVGTIMLRLSCGKEILSRRLQEASPCQLDNSAAVRHAGPGRISHLHKHEISNCAPANPMARQVAGSA